MPVPSLEKSWLFQHTSVPNNVGDDCGLSYRRLMLFIKDAFKWAGWTVVGSSNGTTAGLDGTDRWLSTANVWWTNGTGNNRPWIVLRNTAIGGASNFQLLLDLVNLYGDWWESNVMAYASVADGFTGGAINARPTATDEIVLRNNASEWTTKYHHNYSAAFASVIHAARSTDLTSTRIFTCGDGMTRGLWMFESLSSPTTGIAPVICVMNSPRNGTNPAIYSQLNDNSWGAVGRRTLATAQSFNAFLTSEMARGSAFGEYFTGALSDGSYIMCPAGVASETVGARGRHGKIVDLWWGETGRSEGSQYLIGGSASLMQFGHLLTPWDGTNIRWYY